VTGEALLELTEARKLDRGDEHFTSASGLAVRYVEPDEAAKKDARAARRAVAAFEAALGGPGWRAHLDERSAVDYVLLAELFGNQDTFLSSTFVHLRKDGRLAMGPVWDFDLSAGNVVLPELALVDRWMHANRAWAGALHADPGFRAALAARWGGLRAGGLLEALLRDADRHARTLRARGAHAAAVAALKDWLVRRATWMDGAL
jgi:hypothetical protein